MPDRVARSKTATATVAAVTAIKHARDARPALQDQNQSEGAGADRECHEVRASRHHLLDDSQRLPDRSVRGDRKAKELRDLAQHHRQRDAVHVAVADRLREQLSDEAESSQARRNAHNAGNDGHHSGHRDCALRIARRQRQHDCEDHGRERRVRAENDDAAGTEQGVREQRHDGRVEAIDARHPRCLRVRDADRHEHGRHDEAGDDVVPQPGGLVLTQRVQPGKPARPSGSGRESCRALDAPTLWRRVGGG